MFPVYVDEYPDEGNLLRFAEVAYVRYLTPDSDLHGILCLTAQCRITCDDGCGELGPEITEHEDKWNFEDLVTREELERTGERGMLRELPDMCRVVGQKVLGSVIKVIEVAASFRAGQKEKVALERDSSQMIGKTVKLRTERTRMRLAVQVAKVRNKDSTEQVEDLKGVV